MELVESATGHFLLYTSGNSKGFILSGAANRQATVSDMVEAFDQVKTMKDLAFTRKVDNCKGCKDNCCSDSIIFVDSIALGKLPSSALDEYLSKFGIPILAGPPCKLLESSEGLCTSYDSRPLICRLFYCVAMDRLLEEVVYSTIGTLVSMAAWKLYQYSSQGSTVEHFLSVVSDKGLHCSYIDNVSKFIQKWVNFRIKDRGWTEYHQIPLYEILQFNLSKDMGYDFEEFFRLSE